MKTWPSKDPNEVKDYWVDWTDALATGETVATSDFILEEGTVVLDSEALASPVATVWLSGGVAGEIAILTNRVTTSGGRTYDQECRLRVKGRD